MGGFVNKRLITENLARIRCSKFACQTTRTFPEKKDKHLREGKHQISQSIWPHAKRINRRLGTCFGAPKGTSFSNDNRSREESGIRAKGTNQNLRDVLPGTRIIRPMCMCLVHCRTAFRGNRNQSNVSRERIEDCMQETMQGIDVNARSLTSIVRYARQKAL
jgi:hypothetical protein